MSVNELKRPYYDPAQSHHARNEAQRSVLVEALKASLGFGTCIVKTTAESPLEITKFLLSNRSN